MDEFIYDCMYRIGRVVKVFNTKFDCTILTNKMLLDCDLALQENTYKEFDNLL